MEDYFLAKLIKKFITPIAVVLVTATFIYGAITKNSEAAGKFYFNQ